MNTLLGSLSKKNIKLIFKLSEILSYSTRNLNIGGKTSSLLLSPAEASRILRTNESTVDIESKSSIKYYDVNYLGSNNPPEDRQAQAKCLHSDTYMFGVFDGHGGHWYKTLFIFFFSNLTYYLFDQ